MQISHQRHRLYFWGFVLLAAASWLFVGVMLLMGLENKHLQHLISKANKDNDRHRAQLAAIAQYEKDTVGLRKWFDGANLHELDMQEFIRELMRFTGGIYRLSSMHVDVGNVDRLETYRYMNKDITLCQIPISLDIIAIDDGVIYDYLEEIDKYLFGEFMITENIISKKSYKGSPHAKAKVRATWTMLAIGSKYSLNSDPNNNSDTPSVSAAGPNGSMAGNVPMGGAAVPAVGTLPSSSANPRAVGVKNVGPN